MVSYFLILGKKRRIYLQFSQKNYNFFIILKYFRMDKVRKAIILANITAVTLVIIKVVTGLVTGSLAVLSSALDSLLDFFVSLFNLYILKRSSSNHDDTYNY